MPSERSSNAVDAQEQSLTIETRARMPLRTSEDAEPFQGLVRAGMVDERLTYSARYALEPGKLLASLTEGEGSDHASATDIGQQTVHQQVRLNLSDEDRIPFQLGLESRRDIRFLLDGEQVARTTRAHLDFSPQPVAVKLDWRLPEELATAPIGCGFNGNLRMSLASAMFGMPSVMDFSHSECLARAADRDLEDSPLQSRAVAWRWGNDLKSALRFRQLMPLAQSQSPYPAGPAHEVGLSHREEFSAWSLQLDIARRQGSIHDPSFGRSADAHWVADLLLNGKLGLLDVSARFMRAGDPLWFMPTSTPGDSQRFSLLFDFGAWLKEELPGLEANMSASLDHTEQSNGSDDSQVNWNISLTW